MRITQIETIHLALPGQRQRVALDDPQPLTTPFVAVRVRTDAGLEGLGFTLAPCAGNVLVDLIDSEFRPLLLGADPVENEKHFTRAQARFRAVGWNGLPARSYAALDLALWDLKAKAAGAPLYRLLGCARSIAPCFVGDLAPMHEEAAQTVRRAAPLVEQGVLGVAVEVGSGDVQQDADRVQQIRDGLGESAWLGVDAGGRYDLSTALAMGHFYEEDVGVDWLEFPIPVDDRRGYQRLAERMEAPLALGATFGERADFVDALEAGCTRILRPDLLRLGGLTPFLKIAVLAEAFHATLVPYRLPEIGVHLSCALPNVTMVEWGGWLSGAFKLPTTITGGKLVPPAIPGHGLELNSDAVDRFAARR